MAMIKTGKGKGKVEEVGVFKKDKDGKVKKKASVKLKPEKKKPVKA